MKKAIYLLFSLAVTIGIFAYLFRFVTLGELADLARSLDFRGVAMYLLASLGMSVFRAWRYLVLLRASGYKPGKAAMFLVVLVRNTFSDLLPARLGSLIYIYVINTRLGIPFAAATSSFALAFIFDLMALAPLIVLAVLGLGLGAGAPTWVLGGLSVLLLGGTIVALFLLPVMLRMGGAMLMRAGFLGAERSVRWRAALEATASDIDNAHRAGFYGRVLILSIISRVLKYTALYTFLFALVAPLGYGWSRLPVARVFAGLCAAEGAASLPISGIAGFGAYQGAWALVFQLLVFPAQLAKVTSIAHHFITQVYGYTLGGIALLILLLPVFARSARRMGAPQKLPFEPAARFYTGVVALLLVFIAAGSTLYAVIPARPVRAEAAMLEAPSIDTPPESISGWVVYERPDGIYKTRLGDSESIRLAAPGTFPRWSPDGQHIAFVRDGEILRIRADGSEMEVLTRARSPRAVAFHPGGEEVCFTDGQTIRAVNIRSRAVREVVSGFTFRELDVAPDGRLVTTVRARGIHLYGFDPSSGRQWRITGGCSGSFSPDGRRVTNNDGGHQRLFILDFETGREWGAITAPEGLAFDNQFWSNHENWIASKSEGLWEDVYIHDVARDHAVRVTIVGDADRPDLFVERD